MYMQVNGKLTYFKLATEGCYSSRHQLIILPTGAQSFTYLSYCAHQWYYHKSSAREITSSMQNNYYSPSVPAKDLENKLFTFYHTLNGHDAAFIKL